MSCVPAKWGDKRADLEFGISRGVCLGLARDLRRRIQRFVVFCGSRERTLDAIGRLVYLPPSSASFLLCSIATDTHTYTPVSALQHYSSTMASAPAASSTSTRASATAPVSSSKPRRGGKDATPTFGIMWTIMRSIGDVSLPLFFSSIHISSPHLVPPSTTPLIVCANHSNTILDVAMLASHFPERRPLHFWAKASFFKNPVTRWILTSSGNIKVDRRNKNNQALFAGTFAAMKAGGAIALFPEGGSYTVPKLKELKMGAAWAALEYSRFLQLQQEEGRGGEGSGRTEVKILPTAVVFDNKSVFRSRAVLRFGKPLSLDRYIDEFLSAPPTPADGQDAPAKRTAAPAGNTEDATVPATPESMTRSNTTTGTSPPPAEQYASPAHRAVARLTADLQRAMQELTFNAPDWQTFQAVRIAREMMFYRAQERMDEYVELSRALMVLLTLDASGLTVQADVQHKSQQARQALFVLSSMLHLADVDNATLTRTALNSASGARSSFVTPLKSLLVRLPIYIPVFGPTLLPTYIVPNKLAHHFAAREEESLSSVKTLFSFFLTSMLYSTLVVKTLQRTRWSPPGLLVGMAGVWWLHDLNRSCVDRAYGLVKQVRFGWRVCRANLATSSLAPLKGEVKQGKREVKGKSLFFYGTLVHPKILARVIGNDGAHLEIQNGVLDGAKLFHVKGEEYPGLLRMDSTSTAINAVKGTLVRGLTPADLRCLDAFEGDEYERLPVSILPDPLSPVETNTTRIANGGTAPLHAILSSLTKARIEALCANASEADKVEAEVYTWVAGRDKLEERVWEFDMFAQTHARNWVGEGEVEHEHEYQVVDRVRSDGVTSTPILTSNTDATSTSASPTQADKGEEWIEAYASTLVEQGPVQQAVVQVCKTLLTQPSIQFYVDKAFRGGKVKRPSKRDERLLSAVFRARAGARAEIEQLMRMVEAVQVEEVQRAVGVLVHAKARALARVGARMAGEAAWPFSQEQVDTFASGARFESRKTI